MLAGRAHHDVEAPVVELGVGGDEHAAAEGLAVGDRDRVAREARRSSSPSRVTVNRAGFQVARVRSARVGVDEVPAHRACVLLASRVRHASRSRSEATQRKRLPFTSPTSIPRSSPGGEHRHRAVAVRSGSPAPGRGRCPARPGRSPSCVPDPARAPPTCPISPSPLITTGISPASPAPSASSIPCSRLRVMTVREVTPVRLELPLDLGQQAGRAAAAGGRVAEQEVAALGAHRANLVGSPGDEVCALGRAAVGRPSRGRARSNPRRSTASGV